MNEYIDRQAAIEAAKHAWAKGLEPTQYIEMIPAADVAPVVHGRWKHTHTGNNYFSECLKCTYCGFEDIELYDCDYCPSCGAKMDLEVG